MNETYLADPAASKDFRDYKALLELFGFSKGRFLVEYPEDWSKTVLEYLDNLHIDGVVRKRAVEELLKKKNEMIQGPPIFEDGMAWAENAKKVIPEYFPESKIIGKKNDSHCDYNLEEVIIAGLDDSNTARSTFLETVNNYVTLTKPICSIASEIFIADRYFQLRSFKKSDIADRRNIAKKSAFQQLKSLISDSEITKKLSSKYSLNRDHYQFLLEFMIEAEKSSRAKHIVVFFEKQKLINNITEDDYVYLIEKDMASIAEKASLKKVKLEYNIIPHNVYAKNHWRLIFCTKCAIHLDAGIRFSRKGLKNTASWVARKDLLEMISRYEKYFPNN